MRLRLAGLEGVGHLRSWHLPGPALLRRIRYKWSSALILLLVLALLLVPVDTRIEPATAFPEPTSTEGLLGRLEFAATGSDFRILELRRTQFGESLGCQAAAFCWDPATGRLGTGENAVFYGPLLSPSGTGSVTDLSRFKLGTLLRFVFQNGRGYEYSIVRATRMPADDPRLRGYVAPTPGEVVTLIDCRAPVSNEPVESCQGSGGDAFVVRAEALASATPLQSRGMGPAPTGSWSDISIGLPGLLIGHLLFLGGLTYLAWRSWSSRYRQPSRGPRGNGREVPFLLVGGWLLLGLALAELGTNYSVSGELEVAGMDWLWGGAAFAAVLLFTSYLLSRLGLKAGRSLLLLAAVLTSLGLIAVYYWETRSNATGHALFFTQVGASAAGLLLCLAAAWAVARGRALSLFGLPAFNTVASLTVVGLALATALASLSGRPPMVSVPVVGTVILSPALEIATVISMVGAMAQGLSRPRKVARPNPWGSRLPWLAPGFAIVVLLFADVGVAIILGSVACLMVIGTSGLPARRLALIGALLAVLVLPAFLHYVGTPSAQGQARLEAWLDPWGYFQESEQTNHVVRAFRQIVERRVEEGEEEPELEASGRQPSPAVAPAVTSDIDKVELELSYRLHGLTRGEAEVAEGLVPEPRSGDDGLLLIAEELWSGLGGYRWGGQEDALTALAERVDRAVAQLREMGVTLAQWEQQRAAERTDGLGGTGSAVAQIGFTYLNVVEPREDNFQQRQSLLALRSGGLIGTGWGLGEPERLPVATEDLPVVVLAQTLGFLGAAAIVVITLRILSIGLRRAEAQRDYAAALLGYSLVAVLGVHALIAFGGAIGLLPLTGISLPFASRGGTSLLAHWILIGLLMGLPAGLGTPRHSVPALPASSRPLRTAGAAIGFAVVATLFAIQVTGHSVSPGALWAQLPDGLGLGGDPAGAADIAASGETRGAILDRDGRVLAAGGPTLGGVRYPNWELARSLSHTLASLEMSFNQDMGESGEQPLLSLLGGRFWRASEGRALVTTIDAEIQEAVRRAFDQRLRSMGLNPETAKGAAMVLDVSTGEILALESRPTFDPEALWDPQVWAEDEARERRQGVRNRFLNRAVLGTYPPGSTFKVVTAAAALESGLYSPEPVVFHYNAIEPGSRWHQLELPDGQPVIDSNHPEPGDWSFSLEEALAWSDNVAFAEVAMTLGPEAILEMAGRFGFEQDIQVEGLGTSFSSVDLGYGGSSPDRFVRATLAGLAHTGYGQGQLSVTPLQMALVAASVANDGVLMEPYVVDGWRTPDGRTLVERSPRPLLPSALSQDTARDLQKMLWSSVTDGWASDARLNDANREPGVAGKTGTAEWGQEGRSPHSWFIGYYPAEQPRIAVAVLIEEAGDSHLASLVARDIFGAASVNCYIPHSLEALQAETDYTLSILGESFPFGTISVPKAVRFSPLPGQAGVSTTAPIEIEFDRPLADNPGHLVTIEPAVLSTPRWQGPKLILEHERFRAGSAYRVIVWPGIRDCAGHRSQERYSFAFATEEPPTVVSAEPGENELQPVFGEVKVIFDRPMDQAAVEQSFRVEPEASGTFRWPDDKTLVWKPWALLYSSTYRTSVGGVSQAGDPLAQDFSWQFRTQDPPPPAVTASDEGTIVLTFDDRGSEAQVETILDILAANLVKAIFFPVGNWTQLNPGLLQRMEDGGHVVGNHTYSHAHLAALTEEEVRWEIENGPGSHFLRLPYGEHNTTVDRVAEELGYQIYGWDVDPEDWKGVPAQQIVETAIREMRPGSVIVLHMHGKHTGEALRHLIPLLRQAGYKFWQPGETSP